MARSLVEHVHLKTAEEFMDALLPRGKYFGTDDYPRQWIFRGHSSASYQLIPSILRLPKPGENPLYVKSNGKWVQIDDMWSLDMLISAEIEMLWGFLDIADQNGLSIPGDSLTFRYHLGGFHSSLSNESEAWDVIPRWPTTDVLPLMAVAQHHAVPTRLLDWSYSSYTAAYFAASEAAQRYKKPGKEIDPNEELAVWAFSQAAYELHDNILRLNIEKPITLFNVPTTGNANLYAQQGLFMINSLTAASVNKPIDRTPLDVVIEKTFTIFNDDPDFTNTVLYELKLPVSQSPKLLRFLGIEGFNGARLFPGYNGVAKALLEEKYWDK